MFLYIICDPLGPKNNSGPHGPKKSFTSSLPPLLSELSDLSLAVCLDFLFNNFLRDLNERFFLLGESSPFFSTITDFLRYFIGFGYSNSCFTLPFRLLCYVLHLNLLFFHLLRRGMGTNSLMDGGTHSLISCVALVIGPAVSLLFLPALSSLLSVAFLLRLRHALLDEPRLTLLLVLHGALLSVLSPALLSVNLLTFLE
jgi:hypothetical protein